MADARSVIVRDSTGALATGLTPTVSAYSRAGVAQTVDCNEKVHSPGEYQIEPTDAHEALGVIVVLEFPAGYLPRSRCFEVFKGDNSNQFWAADVRATDGSRWTGAAPTVGAYTWGDGTDRLTDAPSTVTVASPWLYCWTPGVADIANDASIRVDGPTGSLQPFWYGDCRPIVEVVPTTPVLSSGLGPEAAAVRALREWLVYRLPSVVTAVNASRPAQLVASSSGPFTVSGDLALSAVGLEDEAPVVVSLAGTLSASQVADAINAESPTGFTAGIDSWGRLVLTAAAPSTAAGSVMCALAGSLNDAFGWAANGEVVKRELLVAPSWRGVMDGQPLPAQELGAGFWVIIGDRDSQSNVGADRGNRRAIHDVHVRLEVMRSLGMNQSPLRDREAISACVRAVREALTDDATCRQLGRAANGDIVFTDVSTAAVSAQAFQANQQRGSFYFDVAALEVSVRINLPASGP